MKLFLLFAGVFLLPVALAHGAYPTTLGLTFFDPQSALIAVNTAPLAIISSV